MLIEIKIFSFFKDDENVLTEKDLQSEFNIWLKLLYI